MHHTSGGTHKPAVLWLYEESEIVRHKFKDRKVVALLLTGDSARITTPESVRPGPNRERQICKPRVGPTEQDEEERDA